VKQGCESRHGCVCVCVCVCVCTGGVRPGTAEALLAHPPRLHLAVLRASVKPQHVTVITLLHPTPHSVTARHASRSRGSMCTFVLRILKLFRSALS
jgi:hypothetical protein